MTLEALLVPALAFAASWGGVRASLNGTKKRVETIDAKTDEIRKDVTNVRERVAKIEGALDIK